MDFEIPDKPSIAVLPFTNMSGDPEQEYFSDGITEEIITALSKVPDMLVIARNSIFTFKGKPTLVQEVSEKLGVRYVLEGSVRKAGNRVRITAQLIDATTGNHLWADRYDRDLEDIFSLQDEITKKVITELQVKLTLGESARVLSKGTNNIEVFLKSMKARRLVLTYDKEKNIQARKILNEIIPMDPKYPTAYSVMGLALVDGRIWSKSYREDLALAEQYLKKALELDESSDFAHTCLGLVYRYRKKWDAAFAEHERAISLNPNSLNMESFAATLLWEESYDEAIAMFKKAFRLDPFFPGWAVSCLGAS